VLAIEIFAGNGALWSPERFRVGARNRPSSLSSAARSRRTRLRRTLSARARSSSRCGSWQWLPCA